MNGFHAQLIDSQRAEIQALKEEHARMLQSLVKGEARILGTPVRLEWPQGMPFGWTEEQLLTALGQPPATET